MKLKYIKSGEFDDLKNHLSANKIKYAKEEVWLPEYFGHDQWLKESIYPFPEGLELMMPGSGDGHNDFENTKRVYTALKNIPFSVAIDERFWTYLTHVTFWSYMRARWPLENGEKTKKGALNYLREHYFFMPNKDRALIRNGISRLWWYGHVSYDETRANPFELTEVLLEKLDIAQQLLERSYSRNPLITKTILSQLLENKTNGDSFSTRPRFRPVMMHLNAVGGVTILDALDESDIKGLVLNKLEQIKKGPVKNLDDELVEDF